ncbi:MAG TPA: LytTR family DNA-binding domain-containing protein [Gemmatimonadaceae bacterium]|jgi:two-component system LytT family response regulator|nr:LytTR family DNA-binding domain-containing protein [Gemmatimonadaceae bacterium]
MREIRALIIDDEPLARRGIRQLLARESDVVIVGECRDGKAALDALETLAPDLAFLDVQMPELDAFGVIRERGVDRMPIVVFVTAYDAFAVKAFEAQALDYLVKPLVAARFAATMVRVRERIRERRHAVLVVGTSTGSLVVDARDIDWVEADDYYSRIHTGGARHLIRESLASLWRRLDGSQFVRVHRGALVRLDRIREILVTPKGRTLAVLRDGTRIPVSRRRRAAVQAALRSTARGILNAAP